MSQHAIEVTSLVKRFGDLVAVNGICFTIATGATTALLGGNGAGKTTTLSMVLGLLLPTSGQIRVLGEDMRTDRHKVLPRVNFSSPYVDLPHRLTVRENLMVYAHLYAIRQPSKRVAEMARQFDLVALLGRPVGKLSSGQKTRVALAKALLNHPELLLLDEPTASLDPDTADWVRSMFQDYQKRTGATLLLASHNMTEVERLADDVLMMKQGRIVDTGSPAALLDRYGRATLEDVFLDIARDRQAGTAALR